MSPLRTKHNYHDGALTAVQPTSDGGLRITIALDAHWNEDGTDSAILFFSGVRNREAVLERFASAAAASARTGTFPTVLWIGRNEPKIYRFELTPGPSVEVHCDSFYES